METEVIMRFGYNERRKNFKTKAEEVIIAMLRQSNFFLIICSKLENYTVNGNTLKYFNSKIIYEANFYLN